MGYDYLVYVIIIQSPQFSRKFFSCSLSSVYAITSAPKNGFSCISLGDISTSLFANGEEL